MEPRLVGIGGWLILPAIGLILGPIVSVMSLITSLALFSRIAEAGYIGVYTLELVVQLVLLIFLIYAATRFFGKKSDAPSIIISLMILNILASGALLFIELAVGAEDFAAQSGKALARGILGAAIWIPYYRVSERVKATFVA